MIEEPSFSFFLFLSLGGVEGRQIADIGAGGGAFETHEFQIGI